MEVEKIQKDGGRCDKIRKKIQFSVLVSVVAHAELKH